MFSKILDTPNCRDTSDQHVPQEEKYTHGNHLKMMNKALSKEIMNRASLVFKNGKDESYYGTCTFYCVKKMKIKIL